MEDTPADETAQQFVPVDNSFANRTGANPMNFQFNTYNFKTPFSHPMQSDLLQRYNMQTGEYKEYAIGIDTYEPKKQRAVLEVRPGLTWHNGDPGDPVTAKDLKTKLVLEDLINATFTSHFNDLQIIGDRKLEVDLAGSVNKALFRNGLNYYWLQTPYRKYKKFVEQWEDMTTEKERKDIKNELRSTSFDEPFGNGPFQFKSRSRNRLRLEKYPHHPDADLINWEYWDVITTSQDIASVVLNMVPNGSVDMVRNYNPPASVYNIAQQQSDKGLFSNQQPALWGESLPMNCSHKDFKNPKVRQAIAEFVDRKRVARNYGQFGVAVQAPSGLLGNINRKGEQVDKWKKWVSDDFASELHRYRSPERGRRLLREEGYTKKNGKWYRPNGERFEAPIKLPNYPDWKPIYTTAAANLRDEGIASSTKVIDPPTYWANHYLAGNFVLGATGWTLQWHHPYYTEGMYYKVDNSFMNFNPEKMQAPPKGDLDGEWQQTDVKSTFEKLRTSTPETQTPHIEQLAWYTNTNLPMLPLIEINDTIWMTKDDWNIPPKDDPRYQAKWAQWWFPRMGLLKAESKSSAKGPQPKGETFPVFED